MTNSWFWLRYRKLNHEKPDLILAVQSRLYRAKLLVDACVTIALTVVSVAPRAPVARYVDLCGSIIVAAYLMMSGIITIRKSNIELPNNSDREVDPAAVDFDKDKEMTSSDDAKLE